MGRQLMHLPTRLEVGGVEREVEGMPTIGPPSPPLPHAPRFISGVLHAHYSSLLQTKDLQLRALVAHQPGSEREEGQAVQPVNRYVHGWHGLGLSQTCDYWSCQSTCIPRSSPGSGTGHGSGKDDMKLGHV